MKKIADFINLAHQFPEYFVHINFRPWYTSMSKADNFHFTIEGSKMANFTKEIKKVPQFKSLKYEDDQHVLVFIHETPKSIPSHQDDLTEYKNEAKKIRQILNQIVKKYQKDPNDTNVFLHNV